MSHRNQFIWQHGIELCRFCYELTKHFSKAELYGLTSQIRHSAVSIPFNNAKGYRRRSKKGYIWFLHIALGSLWELDTQLIIAKEVGLADADLFTPVMKKVDEMQRIMVSMLQKLGN